MKTGDRVRIIDIGKDDQFFDERHEYIGQVGVLQCNPEYCYKGFWFFDVVLDGIGWTCFARAKIELETVGHKLVASATVKCDI